uniref:Uncharacterized protein n=1 Tax=Suricata suricatta TaxID=37032 RepID=A0A673SPZ9_SURSU
MGQLKFNTSEEHHADMYRSDLPNPDTLSAELHCWRIKIKWKHRGKDIGLPSTIYEALHLPDIKFFPNVYALLKVLCILPVMKHLKAYLRNTLTDQRSSNLALPNINFDIKHDLDLMVDTYIKLYTTKSELPTDNSETIENTYETFKVGFLLCLIFGKLCKKFENILQKSCQVYVGHLITEYLDLSTSSLSTLAIDNLPI